MKKRILFLAFIALSILCYKASAQDSVCTLGRHPSAILRIQPPSNNEGLLIPRSMTNERNIVCFILSDKRPKPKNEMTEIKTRRT